MDKNPLYLLIENADRLEINGIGISLPLNGIIKLRSSGYQELKLTPVYPDKTTELNGTEKTLVEGGHKIQAIKLHRERTGLGLRESKEICDHFERNLKK